MPPAPMEALSVEAIPEGPQWRYEPKWDGFRCIAVRNGQDIALWSKAGKPLTRYFPEIVDALRTLKAKRFTLDGELAVPRGKLFTFDDLLQRIHPAQSRIDRLSKETPALLIVFDLLQDGATGLVDEPLAARRPLLEAFAKKYFAGNPRLRLSPQSKALAPARKWLARVGDALDGIIAKHADLPYTAGSRDGMRKVKNYRSADCVVGGFRYNEGRDVAGSLLLGLYNADGQLDHVGFTSAFSESEKPALTRKLEKLKGGEGFTGDKPGGPSRWASQRSAAWVPLKPKLVVEICYDHFSGGRFRHGTNFLRWRPDKAPQQYTMDQVLQVAGNLMSLLK